MAVLDIFSKRLKKLQSEPVDVYIYDVLPRKLRVQIIHILDEALGDEFKYKERYNKVRHAYTFIVESLSREYGVFNLFDDDRNSNSHRHHYRELVDFILNEKDTEKVLDAVELSFKMVDKFTRNFEYLSERFYDERANAAIYELNDRFLEHGIGFQFESGAIIRIDSKILHNETIKPALSLLADKIFSGAEAEFLAAHEHYRHGRYKEAINDSLKSFESVLKVICQKHKWEYSASDGATKLLGICFDNGLVPSYLQSQFSSIRSILESGIPSIRNKVSSHGQGGEVVDVPSHLVSYSLHITAASILFLVEADKVS